MILRVIAVVAIVLIAVGTVFAVSKSVYVSIVFPAGLGSVKIMVQPLPQFLLRTYVVTSVSTSGTASAESLGTEAAMLVDATNALKLFALPARLGGLGVVDPSQYSAFQFSASVAITAPLVQSILQRSSASSADVLCDQLEAKRCVVDEHKSITDFYDSLLPLLSSSLRRSVLLSSESGSSSWLTALPLSEHGFALHKGAFIGMLCVSGMVGDHLCYHQVAFVESDLLLSMLGMSMWWFSFHTT